jgi:hypothetical protein
MINNLFTISIIANDARPFRRNGFDYVALTSGSIYAIELHNHHHTRCDAEVYVDGKHIGGWIVRAHDTIRIERPENAKRKFTFFDEKSYISKSTGSVVGGDNNGLISVIFKPEKYRSYEPLYSAKSLQTQAPKKALQSGLSESFLTSSNQKEKFSSGITVLGDISYQDFSSAKELKESQIDWSLATEVSLRLVADTENKYIAIAHSYPPRLD